MMTIAFADLDERALARRGIISQDLFFCITSAEWQKFWDEEIKPLHLIINFGLIKWEIISWDTLWSIHKTYDENNSYYKFLVKIIFIKKSSRLVNLTLKTDVFFGNKFFSCKPTNAKIKNYNFAAGSACRLNYMNCFLNLYDCQSFLSTKQPKKT